MTTIATIFFTFLCTGVLGNWLIQKWQYLNWLNQQRTIGLQNEYKSILTLFEEISESAGKRQSRMNRLLRVLNSDSNELIVERLKSYDEALALWNEKLNSFLARLTMLASHSFSIRLEREIQELFVDSGRKLESVTRRKLSGGIITKSEIKSIQNELNVLQGKLGRFNKQALRLVLAQRKLAFYGRRVEFNDKNLKYFSTWRLFKALFVPWIEFPSIVRPPSDLEPPAR